MGGLIKYFRFTWDHVLWDISYCNLMMLAATIPKNSSNKDGNSRAEQKFGEMDSMEKFNDFFNSK